MTRKVLGRGLSALLPANPQATTNDELFEIEVDLIEPSEAQPRTRFDDARLNELAQSIKNNGVVQPLLVRRNGSRYELVAGERRWRAAQIAGLRRVPVVVRDIPDEKMLELALIENIQRQELNPIEEAHAYKKLIDTLGLTQDLLAQRIGRDRSFIANHIRLLRLPETVQQMVEEDKISMGHARALLGVDDVIIQERIAYRIIEQALSVRETERAMKRVITGTDATTATAKRAAPVEDVNVRNAESKLRRHLQTQVKITSYANREGGKLEIDFYSTDELDRFYQALMTIEAKRAEQTA